MLITYNLAGEKSNWYAGAGVHFEAEPEADSSPGDGGEVRWQALLSHGGDQRQQSTCGWHDPAYVRVDTCVFRL